MDAIEAIKAFSVVEIVESGKRLAVDLSGSRTFPRRESEP